MVAPTPLPAGPPADPEVGPVVLYVHVPFCRSRCSYCDFNTYAGIEDQIPAYCTAVCREIEAAGRRWDRPAATTVYFGGGTPSLLPPALLAQILASLRAAFAVLPDAEVTLEANPGTADGTALRRFREAGVNRLSLGVQSADDAELRLLGRIHTWAQAARCVEEARAAGFDNLSLDFIFGLPGQSLERWGETLRAGLALRPEHFSLYGLSVEAGTPLAERIAAGGLPSPDDDLAAEMILLAEETLAAAGYFHYEISNWARLPAGTGGPIGPGWWSDPATRAVLSEQVSPHVCRHNLAYWRNQAWLGFGAGAHSWMAGRRWANVGYPCRYVDAVRHRQPALVVEGETIDRRLEMGESMMLGLRLAEGMAEEAFQARFGLSMAAVFADPLAELRDLGLLTWDGCVARLTGRGRLLGNRVFARFI